MVAHRDLTGANLHEPKGIESATTGQVYVANGSGTGVWTSRFSGVNNLNSFSLSGVIPNVSTPNSSFFLTVPNNATLAKVFTVDGGTLTTANSVVTVYKNGTPLATTMTIYFSGSASGVAQSFAFSGVSLVEGDVLEFRTNGASDGDFPLHVVAKFAATA